MAHILVVDDEQRMRHLLTIMLEMKGHRVEQAGDGLEALDMILNTPFDMVIADIKMQGISGIELVEKVSQNFPQIVKVFLSGQPSFEAEDISSMVQAVHRGQVLKFINKSTNLCDDLRQTLKAVLHQKQKDQPS